MEWTYQARTNVCVSASRERRDHKTNAGHGSTVSSQGEVTKHLPAGYRGLTQGQALRNRTLDKESKSHDQENA